MSDLAAQGSVWPVLLVTGLALGSITLASRRQRTHLLWFLPALLVAAVVFLWLTGEASSVLILAPERLGIGVIALIPAVTLAFAAAWCALRFEAGNWVLVGAPAVACIATTPLVGYIVRAAVCELVGECP